MAPGGGKNQAIDGIPVTSLRQNIKCFCIALCVTSACLQYGLDTGIVNGFQAMQGFLRFFGHWNVAKEKYVIGTHFQQLITSLLQVGLMIASVSTGQFSKKFGRPKGFMVASVIGAVALTIQELTTNKGATYFARLLLGVSNGTYVNMMSLYVSETAPSHFRGSFVALFQPFTTFGGLLGAIINKQFVGDMSKHSYQFQLIILYAIPVLMFTLALWLPESPRWLMLQNRREDATKSLRRIRGKDYAEDYLQLEIQNVSEAIRIEKENSATAKFTDLFKGTDLRRTGLCVASTTFHAASGVNFLVGYATVFFQAAGQTNAFQDTIILQSCAMSGALAAPFVARYFSRKLLMIVGFTITTITLGVVAILSTVSPHSSGSGKAMVAMVCIYETAYSIACGPLSWSIASELPSNRLRSMTFGFAMTVGFLFAWLTTFTTPYWIGATELNLGGKYAWVWAPSNLVTLLFIIFFLPETQNRSLEDIDALFLARVPARKFSTYQITNEVLTPGSTEDEKEYVLEKENA